MPVLLLLFIIMPIVEITVLIQVGSVIGVLPTVLIVVTTAILGSTMLRQQGLATLAKARQRMDQGEMPAQELMEGLLLVVGGVLLLTPGFVTDILGFLCLIPVTRHLIASRLSRGALLHFRSSGAAASPGFASRVRGRGRAASPRTVGEGASEAAAAQGGAANDATIDAGGSPAGGAASSAPSAAGGARDSAPDASGSTIDGDFRRLD